MLVFEPVEYGTLADCTYNNDPWQPCYVPLLLTQRLKIAMEIANALPYFHVGFSRLIVFRTINPINIWFDEQNVAKLSDFTLSESIPEGETHKNGWVAGTMGLIAPDYMHTGLCNEQSDVYGFGVLLLVLLTGQKIYDPPCLETGGDYRLLLHVKKCNENNRFIEMIDPVIVRQVVCARKVQQLEAFTNLALKCASESPNDRPTMVDMEKQLRQFFNFLSNSDLLIAESAATHPQVNKMVLFRRKEYWEKRGETHIKDAQFRGYVGYTAPELGRGVLNEKCDVYGFGILLLEILTGQRKIDLIRSMSETEDETETKDEDRKFFARVDDNWSCRDNWSLDFETGEKNWLCEFMKRINGENGIIVVVDPTIIGDGLCPETRQQIQVFLELVVIKCLSHSAGDRPSMIDVAKQLRQLYLSAS
ncbi:hypothetical protein LWI28_013328 [Acer negundo]|uniref:Protein kinase domain-containing protein n=1 Tax=Acer negundo TaxID=4023 RepID=A0AAD5J9A8_ACENE|nr:hypothetical protein LWI28_013328 [Acer negundo]